MASDGSFDPTLADIRFGCGLSPVTAPPASAAEMLARLNGPDEAAADFAIPTYEAVRPRLAEAQELSKIRNRNSGTAKGDAAQEAFTLLQKAARKEQIGWFGQMLMRRAHTQDGLRERLAFFWADHFTAVGKTGMLKRIVAPYVEQAIRPHVAGRFGDMLRAVATEPLMLHYLDQFRSMGPNSPQGLRRKDKGGLNENLAREMLELHTLGVDGSYSQDDVRQLAELLTGLSYNPEFGFTFMRNFAEPGAEQVLGVSYGGAGARLEDILAALDDLAHHPQTARHIARKLAVHFVADQPPAALVDHLAARFSETGGDLAAVNAALLEHPAAWDAAPGNIKQPVDFVASTLRALVITPTEFPTRNPGLIYNMMLTPMALMGQVWERPLGPDGWPEDDADWITPQRLAARLQWAMATPAALRSDLPDPRDFVDDALGARAPEAVRFAAAGAESRREGVGVILASPAFQRM